MYSIICIRDNSNGETVVFPIMGSDDDGEPLDIMAIWDTLEEAEDFNSNSMICQSSRTFIIDLDSGLTF